MKEVNYANILKLTLYSKEMFIMMVLNKGLKYQYSTV